MVSDVLLLWCYWFKYTYIKLDLVTIGKLCFYFNRLLGGVVDCVNVNLARAWRLKKCKSVRVARGDSRGQV